MATMGISKKAFATSGGFLKNPLKKSFQRIEQYGKTMALSNSTLDKYKPIQQYYAGKSVFITGVTGFLGKVFVEKLLYSCPNIDKIFLLIRKKDKLDSSERIKQLLDLPIFERVRKERPENLKKIIPVSGDIILPKLGLCEDDDYMLTEKVSYVFHFAANIKFNEPLEMAMNSNLEGTRKVLNLCKRLKNIDAFVHVSTAYTNTDQRVLEEIVYPSPASIDEVYKKIENKDINEEEINKLLCGRPNTYTFTKALAESLVKEEHGNVPSIIIRPSIVSASLSEPMMGWVDNWFGATGLIATTAKGLNYVVIGKGSNVLDLIPVDYVSNLIVAAAAKCNRTKEVIVYNSCSSAASPLTMKELSRLIIEDSVQHNFSEFMHPRMMFIQSEWLFRIVTMILQKIPAFVADCILRFSGKPPRFMEIQKNVSRMSNTLKHFTCHSWEMKCQRTRDLFASLSESDRYQFPFDPANIKWTKYIPIYCMGIRKYLFK